jgi:hypothetical protein
MDSKQGRLSEELLPEQNCGYQNIKRLEVRAADTVRLSVFSESMQRLLQGGRLGHRGVDPIRELPLVEEAEDAATPLTSVTKVQPHDLGS